MDQPGPTSDEVYRYLDISTRRKDKEKRWSPREAGFIASRLRRRFPNLDEFTALLWTRRWRAKRKAQGTPPAIETRRPTHPLPEIE